MFETFWEAIHFLVNSYYQVLQGTSILDDTYIKLNVYAMGYHTIAGPYIPKIVSIIKATLASYVSFLVV